MQKTLFAYTSFMVACLAVTATFITATTYTQLTLAIIFYPLLVLLGYKFLPLKTQNAVLVNAEDKPEVEEKVEEAEKKESKISQGIGISDIDKRAFLKLLGGTGLTLFLFSLFNKRTGNFLPAGLSQFTSDGIDTNQNDQNRRQIDGYQISQIDDSEIGYYGFTGSGETWYIMQVNQSEGSFRYIKGSSNFPHFWENRKNIKYDYYSKIFQN